MAPTHPISRRRFVATAGGAVAGLVAGPALLGPAGASAVSRTGADTPLPADLFKLGVASGEPEPDGVVLWTRLAPDPIAGGGMPDRPVPVRWEVADDDRFRRICRRGVGLAEPRLAHSVHVEVDGLAPSREYYYRFIVGGEVSPVGRTRTAPAHGARVNSLKFAFASCQDFQTGYYTAHQHLAEEDIAFVAFLGDYIYEAKVNPALPRQHEGTDEPYSLVDYRNRYGHYKADLNLQAAHAAAAWIVTLDDHELDGDWADEIPNDPDLQTPEAFRARRVAAFQAYYEHMPLRRSSIPRGLDMRLYRQARFGRLASLHVLDTRQFRSDQPTTLEEAYDPARTMTGAEQENWLVRGMSQSGTRWNLLANQTMWAQNDRTAGPAQTFSFDCWDGYRVQRKRMLEFFGSGRTNNPVVLTGDRHCTWVCDLKPDFEDPNSPVVAAELTGTSITSGGDPNRPAFHARWDPIKAESPHWKYIDIRRGYMLCDVNDERLRAELRTVSTVLGPTATVSTAATFEIVAGTPGVEVISSDGPPPPAAARNASGYIGVDDQP